jgi:hypothetical protein
VSRLFSSLLILCLVSSPVLSALLSSLLL